MTPPGAVRASRNASRAAVERSLAIAWIRRFLAVEVWTDDGYPHGDSSERATGPEPVIKGRGGNVCCITAPLSADPDLCYLSTRQPQPAGRDHVALDLARAGGDRCRRSEEH